jgi:hypothetical protein
MSFTVEAGIYLPGRGSVRIKENVLVTDDGWETEQRAFRSGLLRAQPRSCITATGSAFKFLSSRIQGGHLIMGERPTYSADVFLSVSSILRTRDRQSPFRDNPVQSNLRRRFVSVSLTYFTHQTDERP